MGDFNKQSGDTGQDKSAFQQLGDEKGEGKEREMGSETSTEGGEKLGGEKQSEFAAAGGQQFGKAGEQSGEKVR